MCHVSFGESGVLLGESSAMVLCLACFWHVPHVQVLHKCPVAGELSYLFISGHASWYVPQPAPGTGILFVHVTDGPVSRFLPVLAGQEGDSSAAELHPVVIQDEVDVVVASLCTGRMCRVHRTSMLSCASRTWEGTDDPYIGSVLLPVTVSKQLSFFLDKASTNHHHPLLQVIG